MNTSINNPLHTILKINKFSNLTSKTGNYINTFDNSEIKNLEKRTYYFYVFMEIIGHFEKSKFYDKEFLPRMDKRTKFMRMNRKFTPLTREEFEEQKEILKINNTYDEYSRRQDIPLFTYITNDPDQFENWSAIRIFEWWRSLRMSGIEKQEWPIFDAVKYLFINQFMRIMNSYLKYGVDKRDKLAFDKLREYLRLVDKFYESGGQYQYLLDAHLAFCDWFSVRFIKGLLFEMYNKKGNPRYTSTSKMGFHIFIDIKYIFEITLLNENGILIIPLSFFQSENKFINLYSAPIIPLLGINYRTHPHQNIAYLPFAQFDHDIRFHSKYLFIYYLYTIYDYNVFTEINKFKPMNEILKIELPSNKLTIENIIATKKTYTNNYTIINNLFEQRCKFLTLLSSIRNDEPKKLLWFILHEIFFFDKISVEYPLLYFFDIKILLNTLINVLLVENNDIFNKIKSKYSVDSIYTLICACIVFFMFEFLELNIIQKISITVDGSTTTVSFDGIPLVILEIIIQRTTVNILFINPEIEIFIHLSALFERTGFQFIPIIRSKINNNKVKKILTNSYYKRISQLQQFQQKL
jgi:hypothetical protein